MPEKPSYAELEQRIKELEQAESMRKQAEEALRKREEELRQQEKLQGVIEMAGSICHELNQPIHIMWHKPALLIGIAFCAALAVYGLAFPFGPGTVRISVVDPLDVRVPDVFVVLRSLAVFFDILWFIQCLGQLSDAPV